MDGLDITNKEFSDAYRNIISKESERDELAVELDEIKNEMSEIEKGNRNLLRDYSISELNRIHNSNNERFLEICSGYGIVEENANNIINTYNSVLEKQKEYQTKVDEIKSIFDKLTSEEKSLYNVIKIGGTTSSLEKQLDKKIAERDGEYNPDVNYSEIEQEISTIQEKIENEKRRVENEKKKITDFDLLKSDVNYMIKVDELLNGYEKLDVNLDSILEFFSNESEINISLIEKEMKKQEQNAIIEFYNDELKDTYGSKEYASLPSDVKIEIEGKAKSSEEYKKILDKNRRSINLRIQRLISEFIVLKENNKILKNNIEIVIDDDKKKIASLTEEIEQLNNQINNIKISEDEDELSSSNKLSEISKLRKQLESKQDKLRIVNNRINFFERSIKVVDNVNKNIDSCVDALKNGILGKDGSKNFWNDMERKFKNDQAYTKKFIEKLANSKRIHDEKNKDNHEVVKAVDESKPVPSDEDDKRKDSSARGTGSDKKPSDIKDIVGDPVAYSIRRKRVFERSKDVKKALAACGLVSAASGVAITCAMIAAMGTGALPLAIGAGVVGMAVTGGLTAGASYGLLKVVGNYYDKRRNRITKLANKELGDIDLAELDPENKLGVLQDAKLKLKFDGDNVSIGYVMPEDIEAVDVFNRFRRIQNDKTRIHKLTPEMVEIFSKPENSEILDSALQRVNYGRGSKKFSLKGWSYGRKDRKNGLGESGATFTNLNPKNLEDDFTDYVIPDVSWKKPADLYRMIGGYLKNENDYNRNSETFTNYKALESKRLEKIKHPFKNSHTKITATDEYARFHSADVEMANKFNGLNEEWLKDVEEYTNYVEAEKAAKAAGLEAIRTGKIDSISAAKRKPSMETGSGRETGGGTVTPDAEESMFTYSDDDLKTCYDNLRSASNFEDIKEAIIDGNKEELAEQIRDAFVDASDATSLTPIFLENLIRVARELDPDLKPKTR